MTVCKYFQQGRCMFGNDCKFEHIPDKTRQNTFGNQTWTATSSRNISKSSVVFTIESMTKDMKPGQDKPMWPLGSYGPGKYQPLLISGIDESPEELRWRAVAALKSSNINEYTKYETDKIAAANQMYSNALENISEAHAQAQRQFFDSELKPLEASEFAGKPAETTNSALGSSAVSAFGAATTSTSPFGQPAFGQSAFGQASQPADPSATSITTISPFSQPTQTGSVFGQPQQISAFGQTLQPDTSIIKPASGAFGSSAGGGAFSAFAGSGSSAFGSGNSSSGGGFSAFAGQPSAFGSGASNPPASSGGSAFGQSAFGNAPAATSAFGVPAQGTTSAFAQPSGSGTSQPVAGSAFGGSAFTNSNTGSVFGSGGNGSANPAATNPSGSVFGPGGSASTNTPANTGSVFGSGGSASTNFPITNSLGSVFGPGGSAPTSTPANTGSVFGSGQGASTTAFPSDNNSPPAFTPSSQPTASVFGNASTSSAISSRPSDSLPKKIQPGPPDFSTAKSMYKPGIDNYDTMLPDNYLQLLPSPVKAAFDSEKFEWGKVPEWTPPKEVR